jgi:pilus assembly protein CpaF
MNETETGTLSKQVMYERVYDIFGILLDQWLQQLGLKQVYDDPCTYQGKTPFAEQVDRALDIEVGGDGHARKAQVETYATAYLQERDAVLSDEEYAFLVELVHNELFGASLLEPLLQDADVREIMVNGPQQIFVYRRRGPAEKYQPVFSSAEHLLRTIHRLIQPLDEKFGKHKPTVETRLPDGSLLTAVLPPIALNGPCMTVVKFYPDTLSVEDLIRFGSLTEDIAQFLQASVASRMNVIVSGGTASGKTTVLNILTGFIGKQERVVTVEEVASLHVRHEHVVSLQCQPANRSGEGGATMADLLRLAWLMRPERIITSELAGSGALELLQLMGRGHEGSMCLLHANSPRDALAQLEMMIKFTRPDLPVPYLRTLIASTIDLIVQTNRLVDGSRKITSVTEIRGLHEESYLLNDIFAFAQTGQNEQGRIFGEFKSYTASEGISGRLRALGYRVKR